MTTAPPITIDALAKELGDRKGVLWAVESCKRVKSKTTPTDQAASAAAEAWVKDPTPANHTAAAAAAKKTDFQGPGAWAAQAAAWAHPTGQTAPAAPAAPAQPGSPGTAALVPKAVAGSVSISAALAAGAKPPAGAPTLPAPPQLGTAPSAPAAPTMPTMPQAPAAPQTPSPAELSKIAKIHQPFIDLGKKILLDKSPM